MKPFEIDKYFTERAIIKILCRKRALAAKKSHDKHFLRNISTSAKNPNANIPPFIYTLFPPRRDWIRANKKERIIRNTNSVELNAIQLERTVFQAFNKHKTNMLNSPKWLLDIQLFVKDIRFAALDSNSNYVIPKPSIFPVLKDKAKKHYRPISSFELKDLIIIGQTAKYLTNCFDQLFLDCSYAFRTGINSTKKFNHHQAVRNLIAYKKDNVKYYVAECDIKKFFDCVSHSEIKLKFAQFVADAATQFGITIHDRANYIFHSYLNSFSFNHDIAMCEPQLLQSYGIRSGSIPWVTVDEFKDIGVDVNNSRIGIPQGGALSCLIANVILHDVDKKVIENGDDQLFFARFCDDMILIHPDLNTCSRIFEVYKSSLAEVKLVCHQPEILKNYNAKFWKIKSKLPYCWDASVPNSDKSSNVPWLSFVGYQVRYDNLVRIRKSSIEKELKKQVKETGKILRVLKQSKKSNINQKAIVFRLTQRLISMAVGRIQHSNTKISMCWAAGFNVVKDSKNILSQFLKLDRNRERQIRRLSRFVKSIPDVQRISKKPFKRLKYYGKRFSYHTQFI